MHIVLILVVVVAIAAYVLMSQNREGEQAMAPDGAPPRLPLSVRHSPISVGASCFSSRATRMRGKYTANTSSS